MSASNPVERLYSPTLACLERVLFFAFLPRRKMSASSSVSAGSSLSMSSLCPFAETCRDESFCSVPVLKSVPSTSFSRTYSEYTASPTNASTTGLKLRAPSGVRKLLSPNILLRIIIPFDYTIL